ncbi:hypothetical protein bpmyx0001_31880 [Bacillus pseudomycoides DSM 12442]|nr:hypothetical protein bpmyx0001_31880 [Bacillus pseudomycoides DSM 12442]
MELAAFADLLTSKEKALIGVSFLYEKIPTQCAGERANCSVG